MKATLINEKNSHPYNEYILKNYDHQGLWNADSVTLGNFQMWQIFDGRFLIGQFNLYY